MERFKNILFASYGSKEDATALDRANRLAGKNKAQITLTRTLAPIPSVAGYFLPKNHLEDMQSAVHAMAEKDLATLAKKISPGIKVETKILTGKPFIELIRSVLTGPHDLIIKPKQPAPGGKTLAGTDLHLLRKCPCPVWIINPTQRKPFGKIIIAVDPDPSDPEKVALNTDLIKIGTSLAQSEQGKIEVVHAWTLDGETTLRGPRFTMSDAEIDVLADNVRKTRLQWLQDLLAPYGDGAIKITLEKGEPGSTLVSIIERKKPDIVVMGTVARTGLPGLLIGNTAEYVLGRISCSVLAIKPRGFKTPVS
ncbi:universal stress protein Usp [Syntrophotalea carbinolica DSM 2380]|uniref:Universal stress protein Usp n=1 Tax=Syntrophotalea carbinolica (strain DSM 2380 / NBRC 103641 / GraBd1) TaxID=338963 RepID=Q3A196_SYNC1|nr:universal stress protein [Syntrophotalea carbinolica]ABA89861.1 universal stress protein Usp [Syntrophotalea carbinolica DSM 2380]